MDNDCFTINIHFSFFLQPNLSDFYSYSEFFDHVVNKRVSYDINTLFMFDPRLEDIFCGILTSNLRRTYTVILKELENMEKLFMYFYELFKHFFRYNAFCLFIVVCRFDYVCIDIRCKSISSKICHLISYKVSVCK